MSNPTLPVDAVRRRLRDQMPAVREWAYFDHAAVSPLTRPAADALRAWTDNDRGERRHQLDRVVSGRGGDTGAGGAADRRQIRTKSRSWQIRRPESTWWPRASTGGPGDNVVTLADEFPSNVYPWFNLASRGVETRRVPTEVSGRLDLSELAAACDDADAGRDRELDWLCNRLSARSVNESPRSRTSAGPCSSRRDSRTGRVSARREKRRHRFPGGRRAQVVAWARGAGIAYIRREHLDRLRPIGLGWHSVVHESDYTHIELNLKPTAARYEGGSQNNAACSRWARAWSC